MSAVATEVRELGLPDASFRSVLRSGAPRFAREAFGPVGVFYVGLELGGLVAGVLLASALALALELYERRRGRGGALALVSAAFIVLQAIVGLVSNSAVVYLAQGVLVSAIWGLAMLASAAIGRPLLGFFADAWYPFPEEVKSTETYRRVFGFESVVWGLYLLTRSGLRMLVLSSGSIGFFVAVQFVTGVPLTVALVVWAVWYTGWRFERLLSRQTTAESVTSETPPQR